MTAADAIRRLLRAREEQSINDGSGDVVFVMFLEPHDPPAGERPPSTFDRIVSYVVNNLQPSPVMVHVELVVPCALGKAAPVHFSTYVGDHSGWRSDRGLNAAYYMGTTAGKWRALPVFGSHAARLVREACNESCGVQYSLFRYVSAAWGFRQLARAVPDGPRQPAHCATLTARMLRTGIVHILKHPSAWYGPSSLYNELRRKLENQQIVPDTTDAGDVASNVDCILRHKDEDVGRMSTDEFMGAIRVLTLRASSAVATGDDAMQIITQKQLATALFRWSVLRSIE